MGIQVTEGYRGDRKGMLLPAGSCNRCCGFMYDSHQMSCTMTTVVVMVQIAVGIMMELISCYQVKYHGIMPHHCLGMKIPGKSQPRTKIGQQQQVEQ